MSANRSTVSTPSRRDAEGVGADTLGVAGTIVQIVLILAVATLFNFFPSKVGFIQSADDPTTFTPLLGPGFDQFLPWLNTLWLWSFGLCLAHLALQRWTVMTRLIDLALDLFSVGVFAAMLAGTPFVQVPVATFAAKSVLVVLIVVFLIGAAEQLFRLFRVVLRPHAARPGDTPTPA